MTAVVGVDPGGRQTGVVARDESGFVWAATITRDDAGSTPGVDYFGEVVAAVTDAAGRLSGTVLVAVEGVVHPNGHVRMMNVTGLLGTAMVLGALMQEFPAAVVVPPGGHGAGPLDAYPAVLRGPRELKGKGRFRHVRSAWDIAEAGAFVARIVGGH